MIYMPVHEDGEVGRWTGTGVPVGQYVSLSVTGTGMPPEVIERNGHLEPGGAVLTKPFEIAALSGGIKAMLA